MFVVGIAQLATTLDDEVPRLAAHLRITGYEARQLLLGGFPAIVLITAEKAAAASLLGELRGRGHDALAFDAAAVVASRAMHTPRALQIDQDALVSDGPSPARLAFSDILVMLRATHQARTESVTEQKTKQLSAARAVLTGGLSVRKTKTTEVTSRSEERHGVLYVYRRSGQAPWLLSEGRLHYEWLGSRMARTERENFETAVAVLREKAPHAAYDNRLVSRKVPERMMRAAVAGTATGHTYGESSEGGMDLLAHLLAMWLAKRGPADQG